MLRAPKVSVVNCAVQADDREVKAVVAQAINDLGNDFDALTRARCILIKVNASGMDMRSFMGHPVSVVDPGVLAGVVAWLHEYTSAEILIIDGQHFEPMEERFRNLGYAAALTDYDVRFIDANGAPFDEFQVPGGGLMFSSYTLNAELARVDATVSVAKMKAHASTGATLTLKNLFGLSPISVYGGPLRYLHAPIRLPRVLVDLGQLFNPCLCIIDGIVGAEGHEWNGRPMTPELVLAGTNVVATDTVGIHLMNLDPQGDYPYYPHTFDRNPIRVAAEAGLGPNELTDIDLRCETELEELIIPFSVDCRRDSARVDHVRRSTAEQALIYQARHQEFLRLYKDQYLLLANGEVLSAVADLSELSSRTMLATQTGRPDQGLFIKKVTVEEREHLKVYAQILDDIPLSWV